MPILYVIDTNTRRPGPNSFPEEEVAIEKATESARVLQRAVSLWKFDSEAKPKEYGKFAPKTVHYGLVYPDGTVKKSKDGIHPFLAYFNDPDPDKASLEETLELPRFALGSVVEKLDGAASKIGNKADKKVVADAADTAAKASVVPFLPGQVYAAEGLGSLLVLDVDVVAGTVSVENEGTTASGSFEELQSHIKETGLTLSALDPLVAVKNIASKLLGAAQGKDVTVKYDILIEALKQAYAIGEQAGHQAHKHNTMVGE